MIPTAQISTALQAGTSAGSQSQEDGGAAGVITSPQELSINTNGTLVNRGTLMSTGSLNIIGSRNFENEGIIEQRTRALIEQAAAIIAREAAAQEVERQEAPRREAARRVSEIAVQEATRMAREASEQAAALMAREAARQEAARQEASRQEALRTKEEAEERARLDKARVRIFSTHPLLRAASRHKP